MLSTMLSIHPDLEVSIPDRKHTKVWSASVGQTDTVKCHDLSGDAAHTCIPGTFYKMNQSLKALNLQ